jgi:P-type Cu+ transporter
MDSADKTRLLSSFPNKSHDIENGDKDTDAAAQLSKPGSTVQKVPVDLLEIGDVVRVPNGSTPPIDGVVVSGPSLFDESAVTGESKPIKKDPGDHVFLGTINIGQVVDVRIDVAEGKTMSVPSFMSNYTTLIRL